MVWERLKGLEITGVEHLIPLRFFVYLYRAAFGKARISPEEIQSMAEKSIVMCQSSDL